MPFGPGDDSAHVAPHSEVPFDRSRCIRQAVGYLLVGSLLLYFALAPGGTWLARLSDASSILGGTARFAVGVGAAALYVNAALNLVRLSRGGPALVIDGDGMSIFEGLTRTRVTWPEVAEVGEVRPYFPAASRIWLGQSQRSRSRSSARTRLVLPARLRDGRVVLLPVPQDQHEAERLASTVAGLWQSQTR